MILPDLLKRAREISAKATPGRWTYTTCYGVATIEHVGSTRTIAHAVEYLNAGKQRNDADALIAWRSLILPLLDVAQASLDLKHVYDGKSALQDLAYDRLTIALNSLEKVELL